LLIAVLKLLDVARHLPDLTLQALDPVQKVRRIDLCTRDGRGGQNTQRSAQREDAQQFDANTCGTHARIRGPSGTVHHRSHPPGRNKKRAQH
jgi:hypothetical protein